MNGKTKRIARLALLTALGVVLLYFAALLPSARLATTAIAGFLTAAALMMYGYGWGIGVYAMTSMLAFLILPAKGCAIYYAAFFGYYPIAKSLFERCKNRSLSWTFKGLLYTAAFIAWWFLVASVLTVTKISVGWYLAWPVGAAFFIVYDICLSKMIYFYIKRISGYIK
jgi:hypothetical protein